MNKIADVVFVILGIVSLVGSVFLLYGISLFDREVSDVLSQIDVPLDPTGVQALGRQIRGIITVGYIWSIVVLISSLALIYCAVADLRRQGSLVGRKR